MNKKLIKLTEADLHKIVKQSVNRVLKESDRDFRGEAYDKASSLASDIETLLNNHLGRVNDSDQAPMKMYAILHEYGEENAEKGKQAIELMIQAKKTLEDVARHLNFGDINDYWGRRYGSRPGAMGTISLTNI